MDNFPEFFQQSPRKQGTPPENLARAGSTGCTVPAMHTAQLEAAPEGDEMKHPELADIAKLLSDGSLAAECCRHLAEVCPVCGERLAQVEALMQRFGHWDAETVVREGPPAAGLLESLLAKGRSAKGWSSLVTKNAEYQTWGVAWVALERARELLAAGASGKQSRDLALLAAAIAAYLGASYHPDSVADLKALAHATAAAAWPAGKGSFDRLRQVAAAVTALDQGTGDPAVAREVMRLLSRVVHEPAASTPSNGETAPTSR